ncbi:hypothetical protein [Paenibacillus sp. J2TS4]|uniref:hypothetical protein n=1 Tax=Paenibacillus sp. J2TS4 TaxID=2807194 RepID=UPI001B025861|nr:hypothetical protein [Paenibacillus sp. J2TS4]GIP32282.1 hypothetical protein J2TS4_14920 [Paenibacillus sp. J2TS4]
MQNIDRYILVVIIALLILWGWSRLRQWWNKPPEESDWEIEVDEEIPVTAAVELLEESGYEVMTLKRKVNINIWVNEQEEYQSRLFIDHFARKDEGLYVVKLAKERKPLDMTGSGLRDMLMAYALIFNEAEGILYVDPKLRTIQKIQFEINGDKGDD